jgi:hypothetical protein
MPAELVDADQQDVAIFTIMATTPYTSKVMPRATRRRMTARETSPSSATFVEGDHHDLGGQDEVGADGPPLIAVFTVPVATRQRQRLPDRGVFGSRSTGRSVRLTGVEL